MHGVAQQSFGALVPCFCAATSGGQQLLIDQERAHERVLYELFLSNITHSSTSSQQLLFPIQIELNAMQKALYTEYVSLLTEVGFRLGDLKEDHVEVVGIPSICSENKAIKVFENLFETLANEYPEDSFSQTDLVAKSLARTLSIKRGKHLEIEEQQQLINDLFACKETQLSPFNRQIFISLSKEELEKKFN